jgi:hypothetical protein
MQKTALLLVLAVAGCTSSKSGNPMMMNGCRCTNAVPGGTLDIACGGIGCVGGAGYRCLAADQFESSPSACGSGSPTPNDSGVVPFPDGGVILFVPDLAGVDLAGADLGSQLGCYGVELCASRCSISTCVTDCYNRSTDTGATLDNNFYMCQITYCTTVDTAGDAGFACNAADANILNSGGTGTLSTSCSQCLGNYGFTGVWSSYCASEIAACQANGP